MLQKGENNTIGNNVSVEDYMRDVETVDDSSSINREITRTWMQGGHSCVLVIPAYLATKYGLCDKKRKAGCHVSIKDTGVGLLIKKAIIS